LPKKLEVILFFPSLFITPFTLSMQGASIHAFFACRYFLYFCVNLLAQQPCMERVKGVINKEGKKRITSSFLGK